MSTEELLVYYKVSRVALLVAVLGGIVWYLYFTQRGKRLEEPAKRMMEDDHVA
ncbi:MAG: cbb3-type cytochrome c oxidase subunit 3 [Spirochaetia bacterium]|nr:cbb3-type cytochrome c oxidase subunit 3 [Spirochaetia bacterium]